MRNEMITWGVLAGIAAIISYPNIGIEFMIRIAIIYLAVSQLNDMVVRKKWGVTGLVVVDENNNRNMDFRFMKFLLVPLCVAVIFACMVWDYI